MLHSHLPGTYHNPTIIPAFGECIWVAYEGTLWVHSGTTRGLQNVVRKTGFDIVIMNILLSQNQTQYSSVKGWPPYPLDQEEMH